VFVAPGIAILYAMLHEAEEFGVTYQMAADMGYQIEWDAAVASLSKMHKRGIRVLPGGDYGFPYNPIGRNARDLDLFVRLFGFSPAEALSAATAQGAALMDLPVGEIRQGCLADILLVAGDPTEDVTILQDKANLAAIMKGGRFHKRPATTHH
jgi:imidazolonepropionase-like amidohydrolase